MKSLYTEQSKFLWLIFTAILVGFLEALSFAQISLPFYIALPFYSIIIIAVGWQTVLKGWKALLALNFKSINLLMLIAVAGAFFLHQFEEAAVVIVLFSLAEHLEETGIAKSKSALDTLINKMPKRAFLLKANNFVNTEEVNPGDLIRVKPGQMIPLDGKVVSGSSFVDESTITGEPIPQDKRPEDFVYAGTLNNQGVLDIEVTKGFKDTSLAKIREMTFHASKYKAETQKFIEQFSSVYTPLVMLLAFLWAFLPPLMLQKDFERNFYEALNLLVIACPCALVISTPIAIFSAIGSATRRGVLIKGGRFLEALARIKAIAFDKTRTLTIGKPVVSDIIAYSDTTQDELLACAAGIEQMSEHPLAESIVKAAERQNLAIHSVENFESFSGKGARADCLVCYDRHHCIGKLQFILEEHKVPENVVKEVELLQDQGKSVIVVSTHNSVEGIIALSDEIRAESHELIKQIKQLGIVPVMLTGDHELSALVVAKKLGIDEVKADLLPQDKGQIVQQLVEKYKVAGMVGDGINDAPALALASVGISMAGLGSDTALESASVVLLNDRLLLIPYLISLGRRALWMIQFNTFFAILVKLAVIVLALLGKTNLALAILADVGVTLFVILNSLRLMSVPSPVNEGINS